MNLKSLLGLFVFFLLPLIANAQTADRVEVFGGYSYTQYSVFGLYSGPWEKFGFSGWAAAPSVRLAPHVALEADFGGASNSHEGFSYTLHTYTAGPRMSFEAKKIQLYGHALFGALIFNGAASTAADGDATFAAVLGGGADVWFSHHFGVRLIQVNCLLNRSPAAAQTDQGGPGPMAHLNIATGVVVRF